MKLSLTSHSSTQSLTRDTIDVIFPTFGTRAIDVPSYDQDKHMYIVDQHTSAAGNRSITYVAIGDRLVVEAVMGIYHCWTIMNWIRLLVFDGAELKVAKTYNWEGTNYYDISKLSDKITDLAIQYVLDSLKMEGQDATEEIISQARTIIGMILEEDVVDHVDNNTVRILQAYCRQMKVCRDYIAK